MEDHLKAASEEFQEAFGTVPAPETTLQDALEQEEGTERNEIEKGVTEAKAAVAQVKQCLADVDPGGDTDIQFLQKQGDLIERELEVFEERLHSAMCDGSATQQAPAQPPQPAQTRPEGLLPEVVEYEMYEEEHGQSGNWHAEDHAEFMRVLKESKGDYAATVSQCSESMIGFDRMDIIAHAQWHSKYVELGLRKKLAIQQWQQHRSHVAQTEKAQAADMVSNGAKVSQGSNNKRNVQQEVQRQYTKAVVAQWKACKAEERARAMEEKTAAKAEKQAREREAHRKRQQELAAVLAQRCAESAQAHCAELQHSQESTGMFQLQHRKRPSKAGSQKGGASRPLTAERRQALADRNRKHVENRAAAVQAVREQQTRRANLQAKLWSKVSVKAEADPSRLHQNTAASAMRAAAEKENERKAKDSGNIRYVPRKAGGGIHA